MQQREPARDLAQGKWHGILGQWLDDRALTGKHTACPLCGGKDRWRLDDKEGSGSWICSHCGAGDGFHLLQKLNNWSFQEAAQFVEKMAGKVQAKQIQQRESAETVLSKLRRIWGASSKIVEGDPAWLYLVNRCGIETVPLGLRMHPAMPYKHEDGTVTKHPAMLAQVVGHDSMPVSIHRTYLSESGTKADVPQPKKLMTPTRKMENVAIRLAKPVEGWLGVAEGIETALCAGKRHAMPVWSCISAGLMESFQAPAGIQLLTVFGDNDPSYTGQAAAYRLARATVNAGVECNVAIPPGHGDWADFHDNKKRAGVAE
jgi:putative DNA primase/helicase